MIECTKQKGERKIQRDVGLGLGVGKQCEDIYLKILRGNMIEIFGGGLSIGRDGKDGKAGDMCMGGDY
jgi:hypothetical protein